MPIEALPPGNDNEFPRWLVLTLNESPVVIPWDSHRILDLTNTTAVNRLEVTVSGTPSGSNEDRVVFRALPGVTWNPGFIQISFNDGALTPTPMMVTVDVGDAPDGIVHISNRAIRGSEFVYTSSKVYGYPIFTDA